MLSSTQSLSIRNYFNDLLVPEIAFKRALPDIEADNGDKQGSGDNTGNPDMPLSDRERVCPGRGKDDSDAKKAGDGANNGTKVENPAWREANTLKEVAIATANDNDIDKEDSHRDAPYNCGGS